MTWVLPTRLIRTSLGEVGRSQSVAVRTTRALAGGSMREACEALVTVREATPMRPVLVGGRCTVAMRPESSAYRRHDRSPGNLTSSWVTADGRLPTTRTVYAPGARPGVMEILLPAVPGTTESGPIMRRIQSECRATLVYSEGPLRHSTDEPAPRDTTPTSTRRSGFAGSTAVSGPPLSPKQAEAVWRPAA